MAKSKMILWIDDEIVKYLDSCAKARDYTVQGLVNLVLESVTKDKLVDAVLDDAEEPRPAYMHRYKNGHANGHPMVRYRPESTD